jgi:hypothetical protein
MICDRCLWISITLALVISSPAFALWGKNSTPNESGSDRTKLGGGKSRGEGTSLTLQQAPDKPVILPTQDKSVTPVSYKDYSKYIVIIEGDRGLGSGFIAIIRQKVVLFSNTHVISGNKSIKAKMMRGDSLALQDLFVADLPYDVSMFTQKSAYEGIAVLDEVEKNVLIGDDIVVLGNSLGAGVITEIPGKVVGIGPERIEVDAKFVEGKSGSPIIHIKTGKVIGIVTYYTKEEMTVAGKDSKFNNVVRRFAYRIDNIKSWRNITWTAFSMESESLTKIEKKTEELAFLFLDIEYNAAIADWNKHLTQGNCLSQAASSWQKAIASYGKPDRVYRDWYSGETTRVQQAQTKQFQSEKDRFLGSVLSLINSDDSLLGPERYTGYHKGEIEKQKQYRDFLKGYFSQLRKQLSNDPKFLTRN